MTEVNANQDDGDAMRAQPAKGRGSFILGLLVAPVAALFVAFLFPAVVALTQTRYRLDAMTYWEVFVHRHHNVSSWFERGWPDIVMPIGVIIGPIVGGMILHSFRLRARPGDSKGRDIMLTALSFAACYFIAGIAAAAIAESSRPYPFEWSRFFRFQGAQQMVTLFVLAAVMSAVGAVFVEIFGRTQRPRSLSAGSH